MVVEVDARKTTAQAVVCRGSVYPPQFKATIDVDRKVLSAVTVWQKTKAAVWRGGVTNASRIARASAPAVTTVVEASAKRMIAPDVVRGVSVSTCNNRVERDVAKKQVALIAAKRVESAHLEFVSAVADAVARSVVPERMMAVANPANKPTALGVVVLGSALQVNPMWLVALFGPVKTTAAVGFAPKVIKGICGSAMSKKRCAKKNNLRRVPVE